MKILITEINRKIKPLILQVDPPTLKNVSITHLIILASQIDSIIPLNLTTDRSLDPGATIDSNSA